MAAPTLAGMVEGPPRRRLLPVLGTVGAVLSASVMTTAMFGLATQGAGSSSAGSDSGLVLAWLVGLVVAGSLTLRRRYPVPVCVAAGVVAIALPTDVLAALVALSWVVARQPRRTAWRCGALTAAATAAVLLRDHARDPQNRLFAMTDATTGEHVVLTPFGYVALGAAILAVAVGVGLLRRWRQTARDAVDGQQRQVLVTDELRREMTRQEEREVVAREVHDTVAHQLSLVSLRASALEVSAPADDVQVREAARSMRSAAHEALDEMRALIAVLRDPALQPTVGCRAAAAHTLADLPGLVDAARGAGALVNATVFVTDGAGAPASLTRATYRILQECLTNAVKHAPGEPVDVDLRAAPGAGVDIRVRNRLPAVPVTGGEAGPGAGIVGMRERVGLLDGTFDARPDGSSFLVTAHLPWPAPAAEHRAIVGAAT